MHLLYISAFLSFVKSAEKCSRTLKYEYFVSKDSSVIVALKYCNNKRIERDHQPIEVSYMALPARPIICYRAPLEGHVRLTIKSYISVFVGGYS